MTEKIRPALTPDEWAHPSNNQQLGWACSEVFVGEGSSLDNVSRHGLAALALYGQPFGFTHADVRAIRESLADEEDAAGHVDRLESLADRIAALLPPE